MPDTCVEEYRCGTKIPLWLRGGHPIVEDGVVTRDVCGHNSKYCCYYESFPIKVKACSGNYYVYEFVKPTVNDAVYCADVRSINTRYTTIKPENISTGDLIPLLTPATTTLCWTILGDPPTTQIKPVCVARMSTGSAGIVSSIRAGTLRCQTHVLKSIDVALKSHCG
ncbi:pancreatic secretory granule membrane major glycoprotein GP2-like [Myxocyprinus asiaticus]|uniref:pancreatic secretory granule membrane major glycoprotein GP2-like n=1 Tax=Myxocyprinus asiaticus TaxID=70543 RepID=UPI002223C2BE|nr:pancreatic secretory granule membrane major glycoprotein GP2-like [Myxocyprinus asiaticus]